MAPSPLPFHPLSHDHKVPQQIKDFISSLPSATGWIHPIHQYEQFWYPSHILPGVLACEKHFEARDDDILLATFPKSGTTWLKSMVFSLVNRKTHHPADTKQHPLIKQNPHALIPVLEIHLFADGVVPNLTTLDSPRLFSSHMPFGLLRGSVKNTSSKIVYLCRDPKDNFVSLWHFVEKIKLANHDSKTGYKSMEEAFDKYCRGVDAYGPVWDHMLSYWAQSLENPDKVLFLRYDEMMKQPVFYLKKLAVFLECPFSEDEEKQGMIDDIVELCSFENLSNLEVNKSEALPWPQSVPNKSFFRNGKVGDWKNYLTPEMAGRLDHVVRDKLHGSGLIFD